MSNVAFPELTCFCKGCKLESKYAVWGHLQLKVGFCRVVAEINGSVMFSNYVVAVYVYFLPVVCAAKGEEVLFARPHHTDLHTASLA